MALLGARPALAPTPKAKPLVPLGSEQLTVAGSAIGLAGIVGALPKHALIQVTGAPIRWLASSRTAPTSTLGVRVDAGGFIEWLDLNVDYSMLIEKALFIREGGASATLEILYFA